MSQHNYELEAEVVLKPSFQDADPSGIVYHGNYFRFFEEARRVLMEKIRYNYREMHKSGYLWPVIDTRVKYIRVIPFHHEIRVVAKLTEWENRLRVDYVIYDHSDGKRMTKGYTVQVAVEKDTDEECTELPKVFTEKVKYWLEHGKLEY